MVYADIYVDKRFDTVERCDLNTNNVEFETTWIESKNKFSKNIVCGSVYSMAISTEGLFIAQLGATTGGLLQFEQF